MLYFLCLAPGNVRWRAVPSGGQADSGAHRDHGLIRSGGAHFYLTHALFPLPRSRERALARRSIWGTGRLWCASGSRTHSLGRSPFLSDACFISFASLQGTCAGAPFHLGDRPLLVRIGITDSIAR